VTAVEDNRPRFRPGTDHVESWFLRANDPVAPRAVWVKATVLTRADGSAIAEAWCSLFDGDRTAAFRRRVPLADASFGPGTARVASLSLDLTEDGGKSRGELVGSSGRVGWDLALIRLPGPLGRPMSLFPSARLVDAPFPKTKLLTPFPAAAFSGSLTWDQESWDQETWDLRGWVGMQGHNWGPAHSPEYAWGQCVFPDEDAVVEGASGRIALGRLTSPLFSMLVVRRGGEEYRFDRILDVWRQHPRLDFPRWTLAMRGRRGRARLEMVGSPTAMVCLGYDNPSGARSYCLNSKTARVRLEVEPEEGAPFTLASGHGGALEFLRPDQVAAVQPVV
jgi:hypothetical protein